MHDRRRAAAAGCARCRRPAPASASIRSAPAVQPAQVGVGHHAAGGEHVQPGEHLPRRPRPQVDQAAAAPSATRSAPCRTGSVTVPARTSSRSYAWPSSAALATADAQADLGRDLAALPAQRAVPQRGVDAVAGAGRARARRRRARAGGRADPVTAHGTPGTDPEHGMRERARKWQDSRSSDHGSRSRHRRRTARPDARYSLQPSPGTPGATSVHTRATRSRQRSRPHERDLGEPVFGDAAVPAAGRAGRRRQRHGGGVRAGRRRPARLLGAAGPPADLGQGVGPGRWTGRTRRSRSGSSAAS